MTRTLIMKSRVPQEGEQLENINHVIQVLLGPVIIDWRDPLTVEITPPKDFGKALAMKYYNYFVDNPDRATDIDEEFKPKAKEIINLICDEAEGCKNICASGQEPCAAMKFLIRHMLWTCKDWIPPKMCIDFKNTLYGLVISDFG